VDAQMVPVIREQISQWLAEDPGLSSGPLCPVREECLRRWGRRLGLTEAG
jgi:ATP-dependent DNA helicase RecG